MASSGDVTLFSLLSTSNLDEPMPIWNQPNFILILCIILSIISWIIVLSRLYVRFRVVFSPGWDDLLIGLFLISETAGVITLCISSRHGLGEHFLLLPTPTMMAFLQTFYAAVITYNSSTALIKMSLLAQFIRIFEDGSLAKIACKLLLVFTGLWGFCYTFIAIFPCFPVHGFWDPTVNATHYGFGSLNPDVLYGTHVSLAITNVILDLGVLAFAVILYLKENSLQKSKRGVYTLLCVGGLANAMSIIRLYSVVAHRATTSPVFDPSWYAPGTMVVSALEVHVATICACVPVFWPVLSDNIGKIFITQEVHITRMPRQQRIDDDDEVELQRNDSNYERLRLEGTQLRSTTPYEQGLSDGSATWKEGYYGDDFTVAQVDPLHKERLHKVDTEVITKSSKKKLRL